MTSESLPDDLEPAPSECATDAAGALSRRAPLAQAPSDEPLNGTASREVDALFVFPEESIASPDTDRAARAIAVESHQPSSRGQTGDGPASGAAGADSTTLDDLRQLIRETGAQLVRECASIGDACRQVERRRELATATLLDLDRRVNELEQKHLIAHTLAEATRAADVVSALDARVTTLTGPGQMLEHAAETVGHLERRAAELMDRLEALARAGREHELVPAQKPSQTLIESPSHDGETAVDGPSRRPELSTPAIWWHPATKTRRPIRHWAASFGALAWLVLLGAVVTRSRHHPAELVGSSHEIHPESVLSAQAPVLPSKPSGFEAAVPAQSPGGSVPDASAGDAVSQTRPSAPPFIGMLRVESVPSRADVFVNQRRVGETPVELDRLRAGSQVIWIESKGYERWSSSVLVASDQLTSVRAKLQPLAYR